MLPRDYPTIIRLIEQPVDYITVENNCTGDKHLLGDWSGVKKIIVVVNDPKKGVVERPLNSGLITDLAKNPANSESWLEILRAKYKLQEKAKKARKEKLLAADKMGNPLGERTTYKVGRCQEEG